MALISKMRHTIYIFGRDFTADELSAIITPSISKRTLYDIEYTDIDGCDGGIFRGVLGSSVVSVVMLSLNDPYTHNIKITPVERI